MGSAYLCPVKPLICGNEPPDVFWVESRIVSEFNVRVDTLLTDSAVGILRSFHQESTICYCDFIALVVFSARFFWTIIVTTRPEITTDQRNFVYWLCKYFQSILRTLLPLHHDSITVPVCRGRRQTREKATPPDLIQPACALQLVPLPRSSQVFTASPEPNRVRLDTPHPNKVGEDLPDGLELLADAVGMVQQVGRHIQVQDSQLGRVKSTSVNENSQGNSLKAITTVHVECMRKMKRLSVRFCLQAPKPPACHLVRCQLLPLRFAVYVDSVCPQSPFNVRPKCDGRRRKSD